MSDAPPGGLAALSDQTEQFRAAAMKKKPDVKDDVPSQSDLDWDRHHKGQDWAEEQK